MQQITIEIDESVIKDAEKTCKKMGISLSSAITLFLETMIKEKHIPFDYSDDLFYLDSNVKYLSNIMKDVKTHKARFSKHIIK